MVMGMLVGMPKIAKELSALEVKRLTDPGWHAVGGVADLVLQVGKPSQDGGAIPRSWLFRFRFGGKREVVGIGSYPQVSLAQAREQAKKYALDVKNGINPLAKKKTEKSALLAQAAKQKTFKECAVAYERGDYATAAARFKFAAEQGDVNAQFSLVVMYEKGLGVPQDYAEAIRWYRLAAEQDSAHAQNSLGVMYGKGIGVKQNHALAARWLKLAAKQGYADAQHTLGLFYAKGAGVTQDDVLVHKWFNLSAAQGNATAREFRYGIAGRMTQQQIAEAQKLARECAANDYKNCN